MNKQEAAIIIKAIGKHAIETHLTDPGDILDATVMAVQAMVPKPDEVTGLMPCGCGGKAGFHYSVMMRDNDCYVECGICGGHTRVVLSEDEARDAWNTAMGYKGGAE